MGFTHLHVHSEYSLLDGCCRIEQLVLSAKNQGQTALAVTDHGVMYGVVDFYEECKKNNIRPIIGCEVYVAPRSMKDKLFEADSDYSHLVLLVKNKAGYDNLCRLVSLSYTEGFYYKPRVDSDALSKHSEGLIALSACIAGEIPKRILRGDMVGAREKAAFYKDVFKDDFYLEVQNHGIKSEEIVLKELIKIGQELSIPIVATNDVHYIKKEDAYAQDVLMCVEMGKDVADTDRLKFETDEFYLKSEGEMAELFRDVPDALENTAKIAEKCNFDFDFSAYHLPTFDVPGNEDSFSYLKGLCIAGMNKKYSAPDDTLKSRLLYELRVIKEMGFVDYFLIVWDFIKFAKDKGIPVGPGRGSAAGSLVAYCLDITTVDPIKYGLLFERFLNPERVTMPDIDTDFCYERRGEVIDYVIEKYGQDRVAQIITFGTMAAKAAIRDVGRALGISYGDVDYVAKLIPSELDITIDAALSKSKELYRAYSENEKIKKLIDTAKAIEGMPRHASTHAAAVVITKEPLYSYVPLQKNDEIVTTQYSMKKIEKLGLLKMDFLGLRTLTVIHDAVKLVKRFKNIDLDINNIDYNDKRIYSLISSGNTDGVFQLESRGMKAFLKEFRPRCLEDIIAALSLYRPGPMDQIPRYIEGRNNPEKVSYKHEKLKSILASTYGCIVYQEQVMQIVQSLAGFSAGRADIVRRAMAKKDKAVMDKTYKEFVFGAEENGKIVAPGAVALGISEDVAKSIFDEIISFAKYAFNKSHAAAYAVNAYQTAYLKTYYKTEFMAALLTSVMGSSDKIVQYRQECQSLGIEVCPPSVNVGFAGFTTEDNKIHFGLAAIKNVGRHFIDSVTGERERNGKFKSFFDFCFRMHGTDLNKRAVESLIKSGAMDCFNIERGVLLASCDVFLEEAANIKKANVSGQMDLFSEPKEENDDGRQEQILSLFKNVKKLTEDEKMKGEKETMGMYLSGHPLNDYKGIINGKSITETYSIISSFRENTGTFADGDFVTVAGIITKVTLKNTKNGGVMAFATLEDFTSGIELIVFANLFDTSRSYITEDSVVMVKGKISAREDEDAKLVCMDIRPLKKEEAKGLYLKISKETEHKMPEIIKVLSFFRGNSPVYLYNSDTKTTSMAKKELFVNLTPGLLKQLKSILGEDCVKTGVARQNK